MSNLTTLPLEDDYSSTLAQEWDGATGTVYVNSVPNFTFGSNTTYVIVNPTKSNQQLAEINAYDGTLNTLTVNNITLEKGAGVNSTQQTHSVNSKVIISDNYQFWKDIQTAINSKIDADDGLGVIYADETARDAAITSPSNGMQVYVTSLGLFTDYIGGAWTNRATGSTPNASETVAGKIELATNTEMGAGTQTGGSGAELVVQNGQLVKTTAGAGDENKVGVLNSSGLYDDLVTQESETTPGLVEIATSAEVIARTDTTKSLTPATYTAGNKDQIQASSSKSLATNYEATENGFVHGWCKRTSALGGITVQVYSDGTTTPTTKINQGFATGGDSIAGFCAPIKKGNYYRIESAAAVAQGIYFTALN